VSVTVHQAYRFALDPTSRQEQMLRSHAGAARYAWNWGLRECNKRYTVERKWYSAAELHQQWNVAKKTDPDLTWWNQNSKCVYQEAFRNLDRALRDYDKSRKGQRNGMQLGFPKRKKKGRCRDSFRFSTGAIRCSGTTVTLPRLGAIRTHESTRKLIRRLEDGTARILSATVSRTAQRWYVSFTVEVERDVPGHHARPGSAVGIDLGVKTLITGADDRGNVVAIEGPKPLRASLHKLRRVSRAHSRKAKGSANRRKAGQARPHPRPSGSHPRRRVAQGHQRTGGAIRDHRVRGSQHIGDDPQPAPRPGCFRPGIRRCPANAQLQDNLERRHAGRSGPLVP